ncbi:MAG: hypothetical protein V1487_03780 [bacterium]
MITPIIMESDIEEVKRKLAVLETRKVERIHFDIGDGMFSDLLSVTPRDLHPFNLTKMKIDLHLLVDDPREWIEECVALSPKRVIGQVEHMGEQKAFIEAVEGYGAEAGLALKIETPIEAIVSELLEKVKTILLLEIPPGTTGSLFDRRVLGKIGELRKIYSGRILVDGGINPETYKWAMGEGASEAGANSAWWRGDFNEAQ